MEISNPKLYRELSVPFENPDAANQALEAFVAEFRALREKHRICDIVAVLQVNALNSDGEEGVMTAVVKQGDPLRAVVMLAQALGQEQRALGTLIGTLSKAKP